jgi:hypothetical protein
VRLGGAGRRVLGQLLTESVVGAFGGLVAAAALAAALWGVPGCGPRKDADEPLAPGVGSCRVACARLRELGCGEAEPTPEGRPCELWCEHYGDHRSAALPYGIKTTCLERVASCPEVKTCGR